MTDVGTIPGRTLGRSQWDNSVFTLPKLANDFMKEMGPLVNTLYCNHKIPSSSFFLTY